MAGFYRKASSLCQQKQKRRMVGGPFAASLGGMSEVRYKAILTRSTAGNQITKVLFKVISD